MGGEFAVKSTFPMQILGSAYLLTYWAFTSVSGARGLNRPDIPAKFQVFFAGINIFLCLLLIPRWGINGAALAWSLHRFILIPLFIYHVACNLFEIELLRLWNHCFKRPILLGLLIAPLALLLKPQINSLYSLMFMFCLLSLLFMLLSYLFILDINDKDYALSYLFKKHDIVRDTR